MEVQFEVLGSSAFYIVLNVFVCKLTPIFLG